MTSFLFFFNKTPQNLHDLCSVMMYDNPWFLLKKCTHLAASHPQLPDLLLKEHALTVPIESHPFSHNFSIVF